MAMAEIALPALVVLQTVVMSLEILQHLLLARLAAMVLMLVVWSGFLARDVQVKAVLGAMVYHGVSELLHEWRSGFPSFRRKGKDRKVIRWSLFWVRVFIWGATFAASTSAVAAVKVHRETPVLGRLSEHTAFGFAITIATLTVYCEAIEVLVLLYFADQEIPYQWRVRMPLWLLSVFIGASEASGVLTVLTCKILAKMAPWGLIGVLVAVMWMSIQFPWHLAPAFIEGLKEKLKTVMGEKKRKRSSILRHGKSDVEVLAEARSGDDFYNLDRERVAKAASEGWEEEETDESSTSNY